MAFRKALLVVVSLSLALTTLPARADGGIPKATLRSISVASRESDMPSRKVYIWTPAVDSQVVNTLPVIYILHGWSGSPSSMINATVSTFDKLINAGAQPFIAVFPDGNAVTHPDSEWADSSDKKAMVETWLTQSVIPAVEGTNIRDRTNRAIMGYSMGGYGATIISLRHPALFSQVISLAGYYYVDDETGAFSSAAKLKSQSPTTYLKSASQMNWFLSEGVNEQTKVIRGQAATWAAKLKSVKASYKLTIPQAAHDLAFVTSQVTPIVKWLSWGSS